MSRLRHRHVRLCQVIAQEACSPLWVSFWAARPRRAPMLVCMYAISQSAKRRTSFCARRARLGPRRRLPLIWVSWRRRLRRAGVGAGPPHAPPLNRLLRREGLLRRRRGAAAPIRARALVAVARGGPQAQEIGRALGGAPHVLSRTAHRRRPAVNPTRPHVAGSPGVPLIPGRNATQSCALAELCGVSDRRAGATICPQTNLY